MASVQSGEGKDETNETSLDSVEEDRRLYLQATIVRVMKTRKDMNHTELMTAVIEQAKNRFIPSVPMIKRCIEQLIEKQFIGRGEFDRDHYVYIA